jgi:hypothetical protein
MTAEVWHSTLRFSVGGHRPPLQLKEDIPLALLAPALGQRRLPPAAAGKDRFIDGHT